MKIRKLWVMTVLSLSLLAGCNTDTVPVSETPDPLPAPELESGLRGEQFGIDKNINEATIDQYLGRDDTVYRDMRMLVDEASYENIGGDSWLSGIVEGFEVVPYPYLCNVEGLPEEVGSSYQGKTLFTHDAEGYHANFKESTDILEYLFPKDKNIILMCGGGGYAGMTKAMLAELGWDAEHIYNAGGYWFYQGDHQFPLKREADGETYYDFYKLNYHYIDFDSLHALNGESEPVTAAAEPSDAEGFSALAGLEELSGEELNQKMKDGESFAAAVYNPGCSSCIKFAPVVKEVADTKQIPLYAVSWQEAKRAENVLAEKIQYAPSVAVIRDGEAVAFLDANSDDDLPHYKDAESLSGWLGTWFEIEAVKGTAEFEAEDCGEACVAFGDLANSKQ